MNRALLTGLLIGACFVGAGGAVAGLGRASAPHYAPVVAVRPLHDAHRTVIGYEVAYELDGRLHRVRTAHPPGARLPVVGGKVRVDRADGDAGSG